MSLLLKGFAVLAAATVMSTSASAQAVVMQRELSLAAAQLMADAAVEHCRKGGFRYFRHHRRQRRPDPPVPQGRRRQSRTPSMPAFERPTPRVPTAFRAPIS